MQPGFLEHLANEIGILIALNVLHEEFDIIGQVIVIHGWSIILLILRVGIALFPSVVVVGIVLHDHLLLLLELHHVELLLVVHIHVYRGDKVGK